MPGLLRSEAAASPARGMLRRMADSVESAGRRGDTELVHASPREVAVLERMSGNRGRNPGTGKREFFDVGIDSQGQTDDGRSEIDTAAANADASGGRGLLDRAIAAISAQLGLDKKGDLTQAGTVGALAGGMGPPGIGTAIGIGINAAREVNERQANNAMVAGNFNENGSLYGGGLAGEKVGISTENAGPIDPDTGRGGPDTGRGGEGGGGSEGGEGARTTEPRSLSDNYRTTGGAQYTSPRPVDRNYGEGEFRYDPVSGHVIWHPRR